MRQMRLKSQEEQKNTTGFCYMGVTVTFNKNRNKELTVEYVRKNGEKRKRIEEELEAMSVPRFY